MDKLLQPAEAESVNIPGTKRRCVHFVSERGDDGDLGKASAAPSVVRSAADLYAGVVFRNRYQSAADAIQAVAQPGLDDSNIARCDICGATVGNRDGPDESHGISLAHQLSLPQSKPPSAIDRKHNAFRYMSAQGWDPDEGKGLGAAGQGRVRPIDAKKRKDRAGIDVTKKPNEDEEVNSRRENEKSHKVIKRSLTRREQREETRKKRHQDNKFEDLFYGNEEVYKYLGIKL